jgi:8-oxo-dGTP diphosphatase
MKERNKAIPASYLILRKGNEILLMRRQGSGYYDGWYSVPAGHVEAGELPLEGLAREAKEELGIDIETKGAIPAHSMYRTKHDETGDRVDYFFVVEKWSGEIINTEPHKCDDIQWFPISNLPEKVMPHVKDALEKIQQGVIYSELDLGYIKKITD